MFLKRKIIIPAITLILSLLGVTEVYAGTVLEISPASLFLKGAVGETISENITIRNTGDKDLSYKIYATPYSVPDGEDHTPNFTDRLGHNSDAIDWIQFDQPADTLLPDESVEIPFSIKIPDCAPSSHQWFAIFAEETGENAEAEILSERRVVAITDFEISNNHPEKCGGTAEDPNPYTPYMTEDETTDNSDDNSDSKLPLFIGIIAASIIVVGIISFLLRKILYKRRSNKNL